MLSAIGERFPASATAPILALPKVAALENAKMDSLTPIEERVARYATPEKGTMIDANAAIWAGELIPGSKSADHPNNTPRKANLTTDRFIFPGRFWFGRGVLE